MVQVRMTFYHLSLAGSMIMECPALESARKVFMLIGYFVSQLYCLKVS